MRKMLMVMLIATMMLIASMAPRLPKQLQTRLVRLMVPSLQVQLNQQLRLPRILNSKAAFAWIGSLAVAFIDLIARN